MYTEKVQTNIAIFITAQDYSKIWSDIEYKLTSCFRFQASIKLPSFYRIQLSDKWLKVIENDEVCFID
jgi:hypothetical protein